MNTPGTPARRLTTATGSRTMLRVDKLRPQKQIDSLAGDMAAEVSVILVCLAVPAQRCTVRSVLPLLLRCVFLLILKIRPPTIWTCNFHDMVATEQKPRGHGHTKEQDAFDSEISLFYHDPQTTRCVSCDHALWHLPCNFSVRFVTNHTSL